MKSFLFVVFFVVVLPGCNSPPDSDFEDADFDSTEFCPSGALYDEEEDACFIDCDGLDDNQCDALEEEVFGEFDEFVVDNYTGIDAESMAETTATAEYAIQDDLTLTTLENSEPDSDARFQEIWVAANRVLPRAKVIEAFSQYHVDSDGADGTLAYVTTDDNQPGKWIVAFDDADYVGPTDREFIHTSIHEFGHVVFLGDDQLDPGALGGCPNYGLDEGCSNEESHINRFYQAFWVDIIDEHAAIETDDEAAEFYERYRDRFVSEYAATNPVEDAAEVFTNFVLRQQPTNSDTVVDQKILMMHGIPALTRLRNDIRGKLTITRAKMQ